MKLPTRYLPALFLLPLLFSSCIKDELSDCPSELRIYFACDPAISGGGGIDLEDLEKIWLFIFDADGLFYEKQNDYQYFAKRESYMTVMGLPAEDFCFIAWAGKEADYSTLPLDFTVGQTTLEEAQWVLSRISNNIYEDWEHPPLFYTEKRERVLPYSNGIQRIDMLLTPLHNVILLTTEGLPASEETYRFVIFDYWNGKYRFDSSFTPVGEVTYSTPCNKDSDSQLFASLRTLNIHSNREPVLEIVNVTQQQRLYRANLIALLNKIEAIDLQTTFTYHIHIIFSTDMTASLLINGWQVTEWETIPR
ncbi:MAG: FimB/Mfa2 family fimbrial subunit [Prevotellaceae bacterium]|jgi:hypothetical protein|nr:FimB/Mfa2 family fimbrial subunit [Prevotellaceae bacterium]